MDSSTRAQDMLRRFSVRSSAAALRNATASERTRVIVVALAANLVVALAKLAAGVLTGSAALFAEAGHSFADSLNQVLLGVSLRRGNVPADAAHPLGHGRERFLWAFMAAIASFLIGGCLSIALGVQKLLVGGSESNLLVAWLVWASPLSRTEFHCSRACVLHAVRQTVRTSRYGGVYCTPAIQHFAPSLSRTPPHW